MIAKHSGLRGLYYGAFSLSAKAIIESLNAALAFWASGTMNISRTSTKGFEDRSAPASDPVGVGGSDPAADAPCSGLGLSCSSVSLKAVWGLFCGRWDSGLTLSRPRWRAS